MSKQNANTKGQRNQAKPQTTVVDETIVDETVNLGTEQDEFDFALLDELDASQALRKERLFKPMGMVRTYIGSGGVIKPVSARNLAKQDGTNIQVWLIPANGNTKRKATCSSYQSEMLRSGELTIQQLGIFVMNLTESASGEKYIKLSSPIEDESPIGEAQIFDEDEITFVPQEINISNIRFK